MKIRLIEGYHPRKAIEYYRDYEVKSREFLQDENLSEVKKLDVYFDNQAEKFNYDYYRAT